MLVAAASVALVPRYTVSAATNRLNTQTGNKKGRLSRRPFCFEIPIKAWSADRSGREWHQPPSEDPANSSQPLHICVSHQTDDKSAAPCREQNAANWRVGGISTLRPCGHQVLPSPPRRDQSDNDARAYRSHRSRRRKNLSWKVHLLRKPVRLQASN